MEMKIGVCEVYVRCHLNERGGGRYVKVILTHGQLEELWHGNEDLWDALEGIVRKSLNLRPEESGFLSRKIWLPQKSPERVLSREIKEVDISEEGIPVEVWLAVGHPEAPGST